ncbi:MAG: dTMP kinase [Hyphomicrobium sp.]|jgi:dTMP kinase|uniref:dTMP kinase n=1 Tax=Hyphomicrobium sp. TaxID=82 RepID=UPI0025C721D5|nr:dTMP kinase [Hyphomicrobium sp.]MBX9861354.1 dTMP kinase [Hyphomicrobium sp.]
MTRGKFITFEGGEGAGKTTQVARLAERLRAGGVETVVTREPGGTPLGESIRDVVLGASPEPVTELLLFAAARAEHVAKVIRPALAHGTWVLCDRFVDSTRVYQGVMAGVSADLIGAIEMRTVAPTFPDLTVVLDVPAEEGLKRTEARGALTRFDAEHAAYHVELREAFRRVALAEPERCVMVDGSRAADEIAADIWRTVETRLLAEARP